MNMLLGLLEQGLRHVNSPLFKDIEVYSGPHARILDVDLPRSIGKTKSCVEIAATHDKCALVVNSDSDYNRIKTTYAIENIEIVTVKSLRMNNSIGMFHRIRGVDIIIMDDIHEKFRDVEKIRLVEEFKPKILLNVFSSDDKGQYAIRK